MCFWRLIPEGPGVHSLKKCPIGLIKLQKNIIPMGPNFMSPESMKNIARVGQIEQNKVPI